MKGIIFFDCDGVLTIEESSWITLHKHFGSMDNRIFAEMYRRGEITYLDWMKIDIALMINSWGRPITRDEVINALSKIHIRDEVYYVGKTLKRLGYLIGVVSSGVDHVVKRVCDILGADVCLYNELTYNNEGYIVPGGKDWVPLHEKPALITMIARGLGFSRDDIVYVGDSIWDIPVFREVGTSIAIKPCGDACAYADYTVDSLDDIIPILASRAS